MGLDQFAFCTRARIPDVDFPHPKKRRQIAAWRKHHDLHDWMQDLWGKKCLKMRLAEWQAGVFREEPVVTNIFGFSTEYSFNCRNLRLEQSDIDALERAVVGGELPYTEGFLFGESTPADKEDDLAFIAAARKAFARGESVYYYGWW